MIKHLHLDFTSNCNLRCKHCYNSEYFKDSSNIVDYKIVLDYINNNNIKHIHFLGGEPLFDYKELFGFIEQIPKDIEISINTNGINLKEGVIEKILIDKRISQITVSLDGFNSVSNDIIRGNGVFDKVKLNIKHLYQKREYYNSNLKINIALVLTPDNLDSILSIDPLFFSDYYENLMISILYVEGNAENNYKLNEKYYVLFHERLVVLLEKFKKINSKLFLDLPPITIDYLNSKLNKTIHHTSLCDCHSENGMRYMNVYGQVFNCGPAYTSRKKTYIDNKCDSSCKYFKYCNQCRLGLYFDRKYYCDEAKRLINIEFESLSNKKIYISKEYLITKKGDNYLLINTKMKKKYKIPSYLFDENKNEVIYSKVENRDKANILTLVNSGVLIRGR